MTNVQPVSTGRCPSTCICGAGGGGGLRGVRLGALSCAPGAAELRSTRKEAERKVQTPSHLVLAVALGEVHRLDGHEPVAPPGHHAHNRGAEGAGEGPPGVVLQVRDERGHLRAAEEEEAERLGGGSGVEGAGLLRGVVVGAGGGAAAAVGRLPPAAAAARPAGEAGAAGDGRGAAAGGRARPGVGGRPPTGAAGPRPAGGSRSGRRGRCPVSARPERGAPARPPAGARVGLVARDGASRGAGAGLRRPLPPLAPAFRGRCGAASRSRLLLLFVLVRGGGIGLECVDVLRPGRDLRLAFLPTGIRRARRWGGVRGLPAGSAGPAPAPVPVAQAIPVARRTAGAPGLTLRRLLSAPCRRRAPTAGRTASGTSCG